MPILCRTQGASIAEALSQNGLGKYLFILAGPTASLTQVEVETRALDEIHQAALKEWGVFVCWHGV